MSIVEERTIFIVIVPPGEEPTALSQNIPVNDTLGRVLGIILALPKAYDPEADWGSLEDYVLHDLYGQHLDLRFRVRQVPSPGCVIAVSTKTQIELKSETLTGEEAWDYLHRSIAMKLRLQRKDDDDPLMRRYLRYIQSGHWRYEPTPITGKDIGLVFHEANHEQGAIVLDKLVERGLHCSVRISRADGSCIKQECNRTPAEDVRALVVLMDQVTQNDPWIVYDVGAGWASGIPVVPILIGEWKTKRLDIIAPYQWLRWEELQENAVTELMAFLDLVPASQIGPGESPG
jgi:hypothetical protein